MMRVPDCGAQARIVSVHVIGVQGCGRVHKRRRLVPVCSIPGRDETRAPETIAASLQFPSRNETSKRTPRWNGDYHVGEKVGGKYEILEVLGKGSNGTTYKAKAEDGSEVAVKAMSLRSMRDWKQLDLFQREAKTLESLQHPCIPKYLDFFEEDTEEDRGFFLVQELAEGKSLAEMVRDGGRASEAQVRQIAMQLLEVLQYMGSLSPPVIHRDVKPENIVMEGGDWGGRLYLVDFGGVQAAAAASFQASTIIGTYGYMAPEQFRGSAQSKSDAYGAGATLLYLLSGRQPSEFPQNRLEIDLGDVLRDMPDLRRMVEGLLQPLPEDRLSPAQALALLRREAPLREEADLMVQPKGARAKVRKLGSTLEIEIPRAPFLSAENITTAGFAVAWNGTIAVWTVGALTAGSLFAAAFSLPFWLAGYQVAKEAFGKSLGGEQIDFGRNKWRIQSGRGPGIEGQMKDLRGAKVVVLSYMNNVPRTAVLVQEGFTKHLCCEGVSTEEQYWLVDRINAHIEEVTGNKPNLPESPKSSPPFVGDAAYWHSYDGFVGSAWTFRGMGGVEPSQLSDLSSHGSFDGYDGFDGADGGDGGGGGE